MFGQDIGERSFFILEEQTGRMETDMKKIRILFIIGILVFSFTACGKDSDKKNENVNENEQTAMKEAGTDKKPKKPLEAREFKDVAYDTGSEAQKLDLYLPETGEGHFPLVVFIHGGAWFGGDKADGQEAAWVTLRSQGYAVASINYRLGKEAPHPAGILDCKTAIRYLKANAEQYHLDEERVALAGDSAGGHYALMTALTEGKSGLRGFVGKLSRGRYKGALRGCLVSNDRSGGSLADDSGRRLHGFGNRFCVEQPERFYWRGYCQCDTGKVSRCQSGKLYFGKDGADTSSAWKRRYDLPGRTIPQLLPESGAGCRGGKDAAGYYGRR